MEWKIKWHMVNNRKDLPHKSMDLILCTNLGWNLSGHWNAHTKTLYQVHSEHKKLIYTKISPTIISAWTTLPEFGLLDLH